MKANDRQRSVEGRGVSGCLGDTARHWNMIGSRFIELGFSFQLQKKCSHVFYFVLHSVVFICHLSVWTFNGGQITYSVAVIQQCHSNFERWFYFLLFFPYKRGRNLHTRTHTQTHKDVSCPAAVFSAKWISPNWGPCVYSFWRAAGVADYRTGDRSNRASQWYRTTEHLTC